MPEREREGERKGEREGGRERGREREGEKRRECKVAASDTLHTSVGLVGLLRRLMSCCSCSSSVPAEREQYFSAIAPSSYGGTGGRGGGWNLIMRL